MKPVANSARPRFLADENFNGHIVTGLRHHYPEIDLLAFAETELTEALADPELLNETVKLDRILLSHDKRTMPNHFAKALESGTTRTPPARCAASPADNGNRCGY